MRRRERLAVVGVEAIGPYTLLRVERGTLDPGEPGPVLHARGARPRAAAPVLALPRAARRARASWSTRSGPARAAIAALEPGDEIAVFGPLGNGFRLDVPRPLLVGGGIGIAPLPYLSEALEQPARDPRLPQRAPRRGGRARPERRGRDRPGARHRRDADRPRRARLRPRADARGGPRARARRRSSPGRRRWPAATAPATAASSRSTARSKRLCVEGPVLCSS